MKNFFILFVIIIVVFILISNYGKYYDKHYENFIVHTIGALEFVTHNELSHQYYPDNHSITTPSGYTMEHVIIPEGQPGPISNTCKIVECVDESGGMTDDELEDSKKSKCKGKPGPQGPSPPGIKGEDGEDARNISVQPKICNNDNTSCYTRPTIWKPNTTKKALDYGLNYNDSFNLIKHSFSEFQNNNVNFLDNIYFFQSDNPDRNMEFDSTRRAVEDYVIEGGQLSNRQLSNPPWGDAYTNKSITREELNKFIYLINYIKEHNNAENTSPWGNNINAHCRKGIGSQKYTDKLDYCPDGFINIHKDVLTYCIPLQYISFNKNEPDMVIAYYYEGMEKGDCKDNNPPTKYILPPCRKWAVGGGVQGGGRDNPAASFLRLPPSDITNANARFYMQGPLSGPSTQTLPSMFKYFWIPHDCKLYIEYNIGFANTDYIILEGVEHTNNAFTQTNEKSTQKTMEDRWGEVTQPAKTQYELFANKFGEGTPTHTYKDLLASEHYTKYKNRMNHKFIIMHKSYTNDHGV